MINTHKTTKQQISKMIKAYYETLIAPMDDMWEESIGKSNYYRIVFNVRDAGYFCLDNNKTLLQFFIKDEFIEKTNEFMQHILDEYNVKEGFISTIDIRGLPLFLDFNKEIHTHTFLYKDVHHIDRISPFDDMEIETAITTDIHKIIEYHENCVDISGNWLEAYCINLINKRQLFLFLIDNEIIGTGEIRASESQKGYAHLGVTVAKEYRRKGLASYILSHLKKECYKHEMIPICSTSINNIGSQKAIQNSGFFADHRILKVKF